MLVILTYNLLITLAFIIYIPVIIWKMVSQGKYRSQFWQRFGYIKKQEGTKTTNAPVIWIHAVSVGETIAISSVAAELKKKHPHSTLVFTTVTDTGQQVARKVITNADLFSYLPVDLPRAVRRFVRRIRPDILVLTESEFWPNLIRITKEEGGQVILANGRISDSSYKKYTYLGPIWQQTLANIDYFAMQSEQDVKRIINLGADPQKVTNSGNTKFDQLSASATPELSQQLYQDFSLNQSDLIWGAGSTHPGEEEQLLVVYSQLQKESPTLLLILAPRHIDRAGDIIKLFADKGIETVCRTTLNNRNPREHRVIILDTIGELSTVYLIADLVFVGGSLVPWGGHNILEPAAVGKPTLFGPHMFNFVDITRLMLDAKAVIQVQNHEELTVQIRGLLADSDKRKELGQRAKETVQKNQGASQRVAEIVGFYLHR